MKAVAAITSGFVGADLANLVNEAALLAARKGRQGGHDGRVQRGGRAGERGLEKKSRIMQEDEKLRVAYHEGGPCPGGLLAAEYRSGPQGLDHSARPGGAWATRMQRPEEDRYLMTQGELESRIQVLLAGTVAEEMIFDDVSHRRAERPGAGHRDRPQHGHGLRHEPAGPGQLPRIESQSVPRIPAMDMPRVAASQRADGPRDRPGSEADHRRRPRSGRGTFWKRRRAALEAISRRLIEKEVIDATELKRIIEENSPSPMIVPGTDADGKKRGSPVPKVARDIDPSEMEASGG